MMELYQPTSNNRVKFVVIGVGVDVKIFSQFQIFKNLENLSSELFGRITKSATLSLQGRRSIYLDELIQIDEEISEFTTTKQLYQMLKGDHLIGGEKEALPRLYITRSISLTVMELETIIDHHVRTNDIMIFNFDQKVGHFQHLIQKKRIVIIDVRKYLEKISKLDNSFIISTDAECSKSQFEEICRRNKNHNVHYFKIVPDDHFLLVMSSQNTFKSKNYTFLKKILHEDYIHTCCNIPVNVLCDRPGMGKSTLLKSLKNTIDLNFWIVIIDLKAHNSYFKEKHHHLDILKHCLELDQNEDPFTQQLKSVFLKKKKIMILLDGLDEVENTSLVNILDHVKNLSSSGYRIWLSSRQNLHQKLEDHFHIFTIQINELSEDQQKSFVQSRLRLKYEEREIEEIVAKIFDNISNNHQILGVPLQLKIITEIFLNDRNYYQNVSVNMFILTKMYRIFFEGRYKYTIDKMDAKNPFLNVGGLEDQLEKYEIAALQSLFDDSVFERLNLDLRRNRRFLDEIKMDKDPLGIIVKTNNENKAVFEHFTFAEYFAAVYLIHNFDVARILKEDLFSERYQNLFLIFNVMLAEENPAQLAVIFKDITLVQKFSDSETTIKDKGGRNLLHFAACTSTRYPLLKHDGGLIFENEIKGFKGETKRLRQIVDCLLSKQIDLFKKDDLFEWNSLDYALASGSLYTVEAILNTQNSPQKFLLKFHDNLSLAYYCIRFGYPNLLAAILPKITDLHTICCQSFMETMSILKLVVMAECEKKLEVIDILVGGNRSFFRRIFQRSLQKIKVNRSTHHGFRLLHFSAAHGDATITKFLLKRGATVNVKNDFGHTPIHLAVKKQNLNIIHLLLDYGADVNVKDNDSESPLHYAATTGNVLIVNLLLSKGADVGAEDKDGQSVLSHAISEGHYDAVSFLIENGARYDQKSLYLAANEGDVQIVELLWKKGLSLNSIDEKGESVLHHAVFSGNVELLRFMFARGVDVDVRMKNGDNILHTAVRNWNFDASLVNFLLNRSETAYLKKVENGEGATPLHLAVHDGNTEIVELMVKNEDLDRINVRNEEYPLSFALKDGRLDGELLLELTRAVKKIKRVDLRKVM